MFKYILSKCPVGYKILHRVLKLTPKNSAEKYKKKKKKKIHRGQFQSIFHEEAKQKLQDIYLDHFH